MSTCTVSNNPHFIASHNFICQAHIKVEPPVAQRPPRRSLRAILPHRAPRNCSLTHWHQTTKSLVAVSKVFPLCVGRES